MTSFVSTSLSSLVPPASSSLLSSTIPLTHVMPGSVHTPEPSHTQVSLGGLGKRPRSAPEHPTDPITGHTSGFFDELALDAALKELCGIHAQVARSTILNPLRDNPHFQRDPLFVVAAYWWMRGSIVPLTSPVDDRRLHQTRDQTADAVYNAICRSFTPVALRLRGTPRHVDLKRMTACAEIAWDHLSAQDHAAIRLSIFQVLLSPHFPGDRDTAQRFLANDPHADAVREILDVGISGGSNSTSSSPRTSTSSFSPPEIPAREGKQKATTTLADKFESMVSLIRDGWIMRPASVDGDKSVLRVAFHNSTPPLSAKAAFMAFQDKERARHRDSGFQGKAYNPTEISPITYSSSSSSSTHLDRYFEFIVLPD